MGTINKGILGGFSGKVGTVVGGTWKGISYMRSRSGKRTGQATDLQLEQQSKFRLTIQFLRQFTALLNITFKDFANGITGPNAALAYNIRNGISGTYPNFSINYSMVLLSRGTLANAIAPTATAGTAGKVNFAWTDNTGNGFAKSNDKAILIVYCPDLDQTISTLSGANRNMSGDTLEVTNFSGKTVQTWVAFISADGKNVSDSLFTGQVAVV